MRRTTVARALVLILALGFPAGGSKPDKEGIALDGPVSSGASRRTSPSAICSMAAASPSTSLAVHTGFQKRISMARARNLMWRMTGVVGRLLRAGRLPGA